MDEVAKQKRSDDTSPSDLMQRLGAINEEIMDVYSIVSRWPQTKKDCIFDNAGTRPTLEMISTYLKSVREEIGFERYSPANINVQR